MKLEDIYADLAGSSRKRFDPSIYEVKNPLPLGKNKKRVGLIKNEMGRKMIKEFEALRPKMYSFLCRQESKGYKKVCDQMRSRISSLQRLHVEK